MFLKLFMPTLTLFCVSLVVTVFLSVRNFESAYTDGSPKHLRKTIAFALVTQLAMIGLVVLVILRLFGYIV